MIELLMRGYRYLKGTGGQSPVTKGTEPPKGTEVIQENKAQEGELFALLAWLQSLWIDGKTRALDYRPKPEEAHFFPAIVAALPNGAAKRLMQTTAVKVETVKMKKTTGFTEVRDPKDPSKVKKTPVFAEWEEQRNITGEQIANALTWLVTIGQGTEAERIKAVADILQSLTILKNSTDTMADLGKTAKIVQKEADTLSHEWRARLKLRFNSKRYAKLMGTPVLVAKRAEIEAAKAAEEHDACLRLHEEYQGLSLIHISEPTRPY